MTDQHFIETDLKNRDNQSPSGRSLFARRPVVKKDRTPRHPRTSDKDFQTKALIAKLELTLRGLQIDIDSALENAEFRDPTHFAFPIFVRTLIARRDNIKDTIAALSQAALSGRAQGNPIGDQTFR